MSAGVSTPKLVVSHADGARVTDVDGRTFLDFAGGIGCQNTGHRFAPVVDAIKAQADDYLHQCFMVGRLRAVRRGLPPARRAVAVRRGAAEVDPRQLGRRGQRERRQDRALGDRPARRRRLRQRLPRPHAADDDDDRQGEAVQGGLRAVRARGLPRSRAEPVPWRHDRRRDRGSEAALQGRGRPGVRRLRRARAGAGGGWLPRRCRPTTCCA